MQLMINPGEGPIEPTLLSDAERNIEALVEALGLDGISVLRVPEQDGGGRYGFCLTYQERSSVIRMPGWPLERVRWLDLPDQDIWDFPRLFVDGEGWVWKFAVAPLRRHLTGEEV